MDSVLLLPSSFPVILGLDANTCSPMWFSKMGKNAPAHENYRRGVMLSEWMVTKCLVVLNEAGDLYTFDGPRGASDIDVTAAGGAANTAFNFGWRVCNSWGVSDHNLIEIVVSSHRRTW